MSGGGPRSSAVALMDSPSGSSRFGSQRYGSQRFGSQRFGGNAFGNLPLVSPTTGNHGMPSPRPPPPAARPSQQQQPGGAGGGPRSVSNDSALMMMEIESLAKSGRTTASVEAAKAVPSPPMQPRPPPSPAPEITATGAGAGMAPSPRIVASPSQAALHQPSPDPLADPLLLGLDQDYAVDPTDPTADPLDPAALDDLLAEFAAPQPPRAASLLPQPPPSAASGPPLGASPRVLPLQKQPEVWIDNAAVGSGVDEACAEGGGGAGPTSEATEGGGGDVDGALRLRAAALTPSDLALMMGTSPEPRC